MEINVIETSKDKLKDRFSEPCKDGTYPFPTSRTIIIGGSGSGKTNLLVNMMHRPEMMKDQYDSIFVLSETAGSDDVMKFLKVPEHHIFTDMKKGIKFLEAIFEAQGKIIEAVGEANAPVIAIIYDDCINNKELLKSNFFKKSFISGRHKNCGIYVLTQHITSIPPIARSQCDNWVYFQNNQQNDEIISNILAPPGYSKREFKEMIAEATKKRFSFLYVNKMIPYKIRYRINFTKIIQLDRLDDGDDETENNKDENDLRET